MMLTEKPTAKPTGSRTLLVVLMATALAVAAALSMAFTADAEAEIKYHVCGTWTPDETAANAWGANWHGQLGDATTTNSNKPVTVKDLGFLRDIAAGGGHSLALRDDCTVWAWGYNEFGELGDGTFTSSQSPVQVQDLYDVKAISTAFEHSLALKGDGTVWAWGLNNTGQLGDGSHNDSNKPVQVEGLSEIRAISAGDNHSLAVKDDGTVWAWGNNEYGQLGDGTSGTDRTRAVQVQDLSGVKAIDAGGRHSLALKDDGTVWAWGVNGVGQLGNGTFTYDIPNPTPVQVRTDDPLAEDPRQPLSGVKAISAGGHHSLALKDDGTVRSWGINWAGQLGDAQTSGNKANTPVKVLYLHGIKAIDADSEHSLSLNENGLVASWGLDDNGQLGNGTNAYGYLPFPREVEDLNGVTAIDAGLAHNLTIVGKLPTKVEDRGNPDEEPRPKIPNGCIETC